MGPPSSGTGPSPPQLQHNQHPARKPSCQHRLFRGTSASPSTPLRLRRKPLRGFGGVTARLVRARHAAIAIKANPRTGLDKENEQSAGGATLTGSAPPEVPRRDVELVKP